MVLEAFRVASSETLFLQERSHPQLGRDAWPSTRPGAWVSGDRAFLPRGRGIDAIASLPARNREKLSRSAVAGEPQPPSAVGLGPPHPEAERRRPKRPVLLPPPAGGAPLAPIPAVGAGRALPRAACRRRGFQLVWCAVYLVGGQVRHRTEVLRFCCHFSFFFFPPNLNFSLRLDKSISRTEGLIVPALGEQGRAWRRSPERG